VRVPRLKVWDITLLSTSPVPAVREDNRKSGCAAVGLEHPEPVRHHVVLVDSDPDKRAEVEVIQSCQGCPRPSPSVWTRMIRFELNWLLSFWPPRGWSRGRTRVCLTCRCSWSSRNKLAVLLAIGYRRGHLANPPVCRYAGPLEHTEHRDTATPPKQIVPS
jgi:hypothetical protein